MALARPHGLVPLVSRLSGQSTTYFSAPYVTVPEASAAKFVTELTTGPMVKEKRRVGVLARKIGMMNLWDASGVRHPISVLCIDRCHVIQVKEPQVTDRCERWGVQIGAGPKRPYKTTKATRFHCAIAGVEPKQKFVEFLVEHDDVIPIGTELRANHFLAGQFVDVTGISIGKGFQGPMKRWGFKGGGASHGNSKAHRSHGSTGQSTAPGRTFPGKKMAGRMGGDQKTVQSLRIFRIDEPRNLVYVRGPVPGNSGNWVRIRDAVRKDRPVLDSEAGREGMGKETDGVSEWRGLAAAL